MVSPDDAMNQYDIETPETDFFSGPAYDKYSRRKNRCLLQMHLYNLIMIYVLMKSEFIQDKITGSLGD
jgi:hypothetical protein